MANPKARTKCPNCGHGFTYYSNTGFTTCMKCDTRFEVPEPVEPGETVEGSEEQFCVQCGNELQAGWEFCNNCGTKVS